jgi:pyruvate-ferredoxin/flavodoxin oxidoreductase
MDTEVYSNTGGQMSIDPARRRRQFAAGARTLAKKDVALQAISYGNVYVARIAAGANRSRRCEALREAEAVRARGTIIAYAVSPTASTWSRDWPNRSVRSIQTTGR